MAWTQADLEKAEDAIRQMAASGGALRVKYADREVTYRSLDELTRARDLIAAALRRRPKRLTITQTVHSKDLD